MTKPLTHNIKGVVDNTTGLELQITSSLKSQYDSTLNRSQLDSIEGKSGKRKFLRVGPKSSSKLGKLRKDSQSKLSLIQPERQMPNRNDVYRVQKLQVDNLVLAEVVALLVAAEASEVKSPMV